MFARQVIRLWALRLLFFVIASLLTVLLVHSRSGLVPVTSSQTPAPATPIAQKPAVSYTWSATQYGKAIRQYAQDLVAGKSLITDYSSRPPKQLPLLPLLTQSWLASFELFLIAALIGVTAGVLLGSLVAVPSRAIRGSALGFSILGLSIPDYVLILFGQLLTVWSYQHFGIRLFNVLGASTTLAGMALPVTVLAIAPAAYMTRITASALDEVLRQDYIRTARSKGVAEARVILEHGFRNAIPQVVGGLPAALNLLLSNLIIVERLTAFPGLTMWVVGRGPVALSTAALYFIAWFLLLDGLANTLRLLISPPRQEVAV